MARNWLIDGLLALVGLTGAALAGWLYAPWLAAVRGNAVMFALVVTGAAVLIAALRLLRRRSIGRILAAAAAVIGFGALLLGQYNVRSVRERVLSAPSADLARVGRHVIVGYDTASRVAPLIARGAVGGLFVTARNARGKSVAQLATEIANLQEIARANGHPPLIISTDQEGGFVSRLSPPLPRPARLSERIASAGSPDVLRQVAFEEGHLVGGALASVGVTLNFAPLADLDFGIRNPADRMSRIGERALGTDPDRVAAAARAYCDGLFAASVTCTLKHFPGLGRVVEDTHVSSAQMVTPRADLERQDWRAYEAARISPTAAVMVGHVIATQLDPARPASLSPTLINGVLRRDLGFTGLVVTDDLCMAAISDAPGGMAAAAVSALAAGVDLLLVAYDPDQVYRVLAGLLDSQYDAVGSRARLDAFHRRLRR
jgi:beta-N-acetylhexosaminidase